MLESSGFTLRQWAGELLFLSYLRNILLFSAGRPIPARKRIKCWYPHVTPKRIHQSRFRLKNKFLPHYEIPFQLCIKWYTAIIVVFGTYKPNMSFSFAHARKGKPLGIHWTHLSENVRPYRTLFQDNEKIALSRECLSRFDFNFLLHWGAWIHIFM